MQLCDSLRDRATIFPRLVAVDDVVVEICSFLSQPVFRTSRVQNEMRALVGAPKEDTEKRNRTEYIIETIIIFLHFSNTIVKRKDTERERRPWILIFQIDKFNFSD